MVVKNPLHEIPRGFSLYIKMDPQPGYLCLLPPPPLPASFPALKAAYSPPISHVLQQIAKRSKHSSLTAVLDISLPCPHLCQHSSAARSEIYSATQRLIAGLYKLICVEAAKHSVNVEDADGIDSRIILLAHPRKALPTVEDERSPSESLQGPVIDLPTLAVCGRSWRTIFSAESEQGEQMLKDFLRFSRVQYEIVRVRGGMISVEQSDEEVELVSSHPGTRRHYAVAVGGTFDHLHIGHKLLLTMTALVVEPRGADVDGERSITIGITGDELLKNKKYRDYVESWDARQQATARFLLAILDFSRPGEGRISVEQKSESGPNGHAVHVRLPSDLVIKLVEIWDPFGPTITEKSISALVISAETRSGGQAVNKKRTQIGWPALEVFEVDVLDASDVEAGDEGIHQNVEDFESKLSSTSIREKLFNKSGSTSNA